MVKLHGVTYLLIGLVVTVASYLIDKEKLMFFMLIGAIFTLIGIIKVISTKPKKKHVHHKSSQQQYRCYVCGAAMAPGARFCSHCGNFMGGYPQALPKQ